jgi:hypothetical protein
MISKGRANKPFTIIAGAPPKQEPILWKHCRIHGTRLIQGYLCPNCGPTIPAIRRVDTVMHEEKKSS